MWWLIFPIAAFIIILCIMVQDHYESQMNEVRRNELEKSRNTFYDYESSDVECETSDELIYEAMSDKIKLEDMTLRQIRELKQRIRHEISLAIENATSGYDVGVVLIDTDTDVFKDACGNPYHYVCNMTINFSKEDD